MKQWEIHLFPFREEKAHPAVILSNDERCQNPDYKTVNVLICTSVRVVRPLKSVEVALDEADGLDWQTAVRCDTIYLLEKERFEGRHGMVTPPRRRSIVRKVFEAMHWPPVY